MKVLTAALLVCPLASACLFEEGTVPAWELQATALTQYNHRGMVMNDKGVVQLDSTVAMPVEAGGDLAFRALGNVDVSDDTGDAWFPDGHSGKFTEVDFSVAYTEELGPILLTSGLISYVLPNGAEFNEKNGVGERGETKEAFVRAASDVEGFEPFAALFYDFDEAEGFYANGGVRKWVELGDQLSAEFQAALGYSDEDASLWAYGIEESGFADLTATGTLWYQHDVHTALRLVVGAATIVDDELDDWFDVLGIDSTNAWIGLGVTWNY